MMTRYASPLFSAILLSAVTALAQQKTVTIAAVNNPDSQAAVGRAINESAYGK